MARAELLCQLTHPGFLDLGIVACDREMYRFVVVRRSNQATEKVRLVTDWLQLGHSQDTEWSQNGDSLVTDWSQTGHSRCRWLQSGYKVVTW